MKVLHIISGGDTGGAKTSVINLLKEMKKNIDVTLLCFMEGEFAEASREEGIPIIILNQSSRWDISVIPRIKMIINKGGYDVINCHGARANFLMALAKRDIRVPVLTTIHSDYVHDFDNSLYKKIVFTMLNKLSLGKMDFYITMADQFKRDMVKRGVNKDKIFVAYNGIDMNEKVNVESRHDFLKGYKVPIEKDQVIVGTASRLHPVKGVDVLLKSAKVIKKHNRNIKFIIAGDGDDKYRNQYMDYVKNHQLEDTVFFLGFVKNVHSFYNAIDINTITSHSEAVCFALLEGGKYGKPTIASKVGGTPELINHKENGLLFKDNDYETLGNYILDLEKSREYGKKIGENLKKIVEDKFSDVAMSKRYLEIYQIVKERVVR